MLRVANFNPSLYLLKFGEGVGLATTSTYGYDPFGQRVKMTVATGTSVTTYYPTKGFKITGRWGLRPPAGRRSPHPPPTNTNQPERSTTHWLVQLTFLYGAFP